MDPTYEILNELMRLLRADTAITQMVDDRIYDRVPESQDGNIAPSVISPYISVGRTTLESEDFDCVDAGSTSIQLHCWSWGDGEAYSSAQVRKLSFLVRKCLNKKDIELSNNGGVSVAHITTVYNRASDGVTQQATVIFEVLVDII